MSVALLIGVVAAGLSVAMAGGFLLQRRAGDGGWADVVWAFATGAAALALALAPTGDWSPSYRALLTAELAAVWSLRLGGHLWVRAAHATGEDARYAELRRAWGGRVDAMMFGFLQVQAAVSLALALTAMASARNPVPFPAWSDLAGATLFIAALIGEGLADAQLARFKADPANKGRICAAGLWGLSRHPNYFFEWLAWLAFAVIAIGPDGTRLWGWAALGGPLLMYGLLRYVSGVPPTEAAMARSRGAPFADYQASVPAFFPRLLRETRTKEAR